MTKLLSGIRRRGLLYQPVNLDGIANPLIRKDFRAFFTRFTTRILPGLWLIANWTLLSLACIQIVYNRLPLGGVPEFLRYWIIIQVLALPALALSIMNRLTTENGPGKWVIVKTLPVRQHELVLGKALPHILLHLAGWIPAPVYLLLVGLLLPDALYANALLIVSMLLAILQIAAVALFAGLATENNRIIRLGVLVVIFVILVLPVALPRVLDGGEHPVLSRILYVTSFSAWNRANFVQGSPHPFLNNSQPIVNPRGRYLVNESSDMVFHREDTEMVPLHYLFPDKHPIYGFEIKERPRQFWTPTAKGLCLQCAYLVVCLLSVTGMFSASNRTVYGF